ncbi:MAG: DUF433 domain-containing protein [Verrucomicrobia bacterium]|nr:DUF433 domain-containing protein [Verrucomicrobiota bacterium]
MKPKAKRSTGRAELGEYIVADPDICHGQPTFKGTRVLVWVVLEQLADGMSWDAIVKEWRGRVPKAAIAEAASLASELVKQRGYRGLNDHHRRKPARIGDLATA